MTETEQVPQDWEDFRAAMAGAIRAAGYDEVATFIESADAEEGIINPLIRLWEQVQFDPPPVHFDEGGSYWERNDDVVYRFVEDLGQEYSSRWNWEPGAKPQALDPSRFARDVTAALIKGAHVKESPDATGILLEGPMNEGTDPSGYDETGAPKWDYFRRELAKHLSKYTGFEDLTEILMDVDYMGDSSGGALQTIYNGWEASNDEWKHDVANDEIGRGESWWSNNEGIISDMILDAGLDFGIPDEQVRDAMHASMDLEKEHAGMDVPALAGREATSLDEETVKELQNLLAKTMNKKMVDDIATEMKDMHDRGKIDSKWHDQLMSGDVPDDPYDVFLSFSEGRAGLPFDTAVDEFLNKLTPYGGLHDKEMRRKQKDLEDAVVTATVEWLVGAGWWDMLQKHYQDIAG